ncbi:phenylalanine--tRNA ligase subunit beta [Helicobacter bilis]|uniref:phenylalanine--tRNA ligase subunit beta n=1 Tax=Helicobacter bilis TaxID=37372 RepID=UPI0004825D4C|nr:phenylalanine--tRNA ligase subunit beta [Helicobacter bilis]TLE04385.1 phenylalanine--tRNA ligase subunit beta [Helicobacter bilis]
MIVTSESLSHFIQLGGIDWKELVRVLSSIGLEVEREYETTIPQNVVVAKVLKRIQHPNADKLSVCEVDIGTEVLQIVCGAKNVYAGQYVALALIDSVLPFGKDGSTTITKSEIRGVESFGMLCSSIELGLPKLNDGILELDSSIGELVLGKELYTYSIFHQSVLELGITPNRGDCLSVLGVARDIASVFNLIPKNIVANEPSIALGVGRFLQVVPHGDLHSSLLYRIIEIKEGYTPLAIALTLGLNGRYKQCPMSNFAEYTTYMTGVLFNIYPMDSSDVSNNGKEAKLLVKADERGLESVYAEFHEDENVKYTKLTSIGATSYEIEKRDYPRTFILEASFIDSVLIANKTYGMDKATLTQEVLHRSTRGSNPDLELGMNFICKSLESLHSNLYSGVQEIARTYSPTNIQMTFEYISDCIGNTIEKEEIALLLKRLNFRIQATCDENFFIAQPPAFRNDIKSKQDIAEEVLRLYGVDNIRPKKHIIEQIPQTTQAYITHQKTKKLRAKALAHGYIECVHYVFDDSKKLETLGFEPLNEDKRLLNPITSELDILRPSLIPHILESLSKNKRYGYEGIRLFEIGYVYDKDRNAKQKLAFAMSDYLKTPSYPNPKGIGLDFFNFAQNVSEIIGNFECINTASKFQKSRLIHPYQSANMLQNGVIIGVMSKLHPNIAEMYDLGNVYFCEIDFALLLAQQQDDKLAKEFSKYQANKRDLTLLLDKNVSFSAIKSELEKASLHDIKEILPLDIYHESDGNIALSIRFVFQSMNETLTESQMQESLQKILDILEQRFHAKLKL